MPHAGAVIGQLLPEVRSGGRAWAMVPFLLVLIGLTWWLVAWDRPRGRARCLGEPRIAHADFDR